MIASHHGIRINNRHSPTLRTLDFKIDLAHDDHGPTLITIPWALKENWRDAKEGVDLDLGKHRSFTYEIVF